MKALSIRQPWASLIAMGIKDVENRTWKTNYRGEFLIHASKTFDRQGMIYLLNNEEIYGVSTSTFSTMPRGGIIGKAEIVDCVRDSNSLWAEDCCFHFVIKNAVELQYSPRPGRLGFFEVFV